MTDSIDLLTLLNNQSLNTIYRLQYYYLTDKLTPHLTKLLTGTPELEITFTKFLTK